MRLTDSGYYKDEILENKTCTKKKIRDTFSPLILVWYRIFNVLGREQII